MIYRIIYISPEHMGHNTCKSMGRVLCVVRRSDGNARKCKQHRLARIPLQFLRVYVHPLVTRSVYICVISTLRGAYTLCHQYRLSPTSKHDTSTQCLTDGGPLSTTLSNIGETWEDVSCLVGIYSVMGDMSMKQSLTLSARGTFLGMLQSSDYDLMSIPGRVKYV